MSQLLAQLQVTPHGEFDYGDWIAALVDWRDLQARDVHALAIIVSMCTARAKRLLSSNSSDANSKQTVAFAHSITGIGRVGRLD